MRMIFRLMCLLAVVVLYSGLTGTAFAEDMPPQPQAIRNSEVENLPPAPVRKEISDVFGGDVNPNNIAPIVFTIAERAAIVDARQLRGMARPPTADELAAGIDGEKTPPTPEQREVRLEGIVYVNANDWTIWLNGQRVTPKALPKEALDLRVFEDYVEMKWFDDYTNQIFPLRLRAHQRFNMDMRIFLPG